MQLLRLLKHNITISRNIQTNWLILRHNKMKPNQLKTNRIISIIYINQFYQFNEMDCIFDQRMWIVEDLN